MEVIKGDRSYSPSDSGCNGLARVTHKVRHGEKLRCLYRVIPVLQLKVPVNKETQRGEAIFPPEMIPFLSRVSAPILWG